MRKMLMQAILFALGAGIILPLQSCYIPYQYTYREQPQIKIGSTTKEEILLIMGDPQSTLFKEQKYYYLWTESSAFFALAPAAGRFHYIDAYLQIEFDDDDIVKSYELNKYNKTSLIPR